MVVRGAILALALLVAGAAQARGPQTPTSIIRAVYHQFIIHSDQMAPPYDGPNETLYTPRLKRLVAGARDTTPEGDVPCGLDFMFWVDGQDYDVKRVDIAEQAGPDPGSRMVIAKFISLRTPHELHFTFRRIVGRWRLDDAESVIGTKWVFSKELQCLG